MGFLDRKSRVVDVVLTERGRRLFANGELDFAYVSFFDDGIDYDPYTPGDLTEQERDDLIHSTPMFEATVVPDHDSNDLPLEPVCQLFACSPGYQGVPRMLAPSTGSLVELRCVQQQVNGLFRRSATGFAQINLELSAGAQPGQGFSIHVRSSGSDGMIELKSRRDLKGRRALDPFIAVSLDDEAPPTEPAKANALRRRS